MQLLVNNQIQTFIPIQKFRAEWGLPDRFQMSTFEAKEWQGLGSVEGAGQALATVRQRVLQAVPAQIMTSDLTNVVNELTGVFHHELTTANQQVGLRPVEVDFAVSGFYDVLAAVVFQLLDLMHRNKKREICQEFDFARVYQSWLDASVRVSTQKQLYQHADKQFQVSVVYNIYGHVGLEVEVANQRYYVLDMSLACPAANYMGDLSQEVAQALCRAISV